MFPNKSRFCLRPRLLILPVYLEFGDVLAVSLEGLHNGGLEVVDGHEVGEEGEDVLDLHARHLRQEFHGLQSKIAFKFMRFNQSIFVLKLSPSLLGYVGSIHQNKI